VTLLRSLFRISGADRQSSLSPSLPVRCFRSHSRPRPLDDEAGTIPWFGPGGSASPGGRRPRPNTASAGAGPINVGRLHEGGRGDDEKSFTRAYQRVFRGELNKMFG
jgi:hypothetical protein